MPFLVSEIKISGTIHGLSFYNSRFGWLVRRKGGPSRNKFKTSPRFERARENSAEFTRCSAFAGEIRKLVMRETGLKDKTLYHRLMRLFCQVMKEDLVAARGQRCPKVGMGTAAGKKSVEGFDLKGHNLREILERVGMLKIVDEAPPADSICAPVPKAKQSESRRKYARKNFRDRAYFEGLRLSRKGGGPGFSKLMRVTVPP